jgi:beta-glucosidase
LNWGLFERPFTGDTHLEIIGSDAHRALARQAVRESLVLLHHDGETLPVSPDTPVIFVAGEAANNIGIQAGGWSIQWQGVPATSRLAQPSWTPLKTASPPPRRSTTTASATLSALLTTTATLLMADVGIVVVGERPYAEGVGDSNDLSLSEADLAALERIRARSHQLIVILISGTAVNHQRHRCPRPTP